MSELSAKLEARDMQPGPPQHGMAGKDPARRRIEVVNTGSQAEFFERAQN